MPCFDILLSVILAVVLLSIWTLYVTIDGDFFLCVQRHIVLFVCLTFDACTLSLVLTYVAQFVAPT